MRQAVNFNGEGPKTNALFGEPIEASDDLAAFDAMPPWLRDVIRRAPWDLHCPEMLAAYQAAHAAEGRDSAVLQWRFRALLDPLPEIVAEAYGPNHPQARP